MAKVLNRVGHKSPTIGAGPRLLGERYKSFASMNKAVDAGLASVGEDYYYAAWEGDKSETGIGRLGWNATEGQYELTPQTLFEKQVGDTLEVDPETPNEFTGAALLAITPLAQAYSEFLKAGEPITGPLQVATSGDALELAGAGVTSLQLDNTLAGTGLSMTAGATNTQITARAGSTLSWGAGGVDDQLVLDAMGGLTLGGEDVLTAASSLAFSKLTGKPTTLSGYGITDAQPLNSKLSAIAALSASDGQFMVGNGTTWVPESGATVRTSLGLGTGDSPTFAGLTSTGDAAVGGNIISTGAIHKPVGTSALVLAGGSTPTSGAILELNGGTATNPYNMYFKTGATSRLTFDYAASNWHFQGHPIIGVSTLAVANTASFGAALSVGGDIIGTGTGTVLRNNTADGSDNRRTQLSGGGDASPTRGAYINLHGNEYSSQAGDLAILAGNAAQGRIRFFTDNAIERGQITKAGLLDWFGAAAFASTLSLAGNLVGTATNSLLRTDTSDGSDNKRFQISGGGTASYTRGALIGVMGNEYAGQAGDLALFAGNGADGRIRMFTGDGEERGQVTKAGLLDWFGAADFGGLVNVGADIALDGNSAAYPINVLGGKFRVDHRGFLQIGDASVAVTHEMHIRNDVNNYVGMGISNDYDGPSSQVAISFHSTSAGLSLGAASPSFTIAPEFANNAFVVADNIADALCIGSIAPDGLVKLFAGGVSANDVKVTLDPTGNLKSLYNSVAMGQLTALASAYRLQALGTADLQVFNASGDGLTIDDASGHALFSKKLWANQASILGGNVVTMLVGSDYNGNTLTNTVDKTGRMGVPHYLSAEEAMALITGVSTFTHNYVLIGGGTSSMNTATHLKFYTASNTTTTTGTEQWQMNSGGSLMGVNGSFIGRTVNTGSMTYGGSTSAPYGPALQMYGEGHASLANDIMHKVNNTPVFGFDYSEGIWDLFGNVLNNDRASDGSLQTFKRSGVQVGSIDVDETSTSYLTTSDYRLKQVHDYATNDNDAGLSALDIVQALRPVWMSFWQKPGQQVAGFLAHEVQALVPWAVKGEKDGIDAFGNPVWQSVDHSKLVPILTGAVQELTVRVEALETQLQQAA